MPDRDMTEKTLEALDDVFADIVNGLLFHGEQVLNESALRDAQPFSMYKAEGKLHEQERDVAKYWLDSSGKRVNVRLALLGIENQTKYDRDMPLRVIGYDGAAYRAELSVPERYPVVTLVLYFGEQRWGSNRTLYDAIEIPDRFREFVNDYRINVFEISYLPEEALEHFHSDFKIVVDYFIHKRTDPNYRPLDTTRFQHVDELLKLMSVLTQDQRFVDALSQEGGRPENMCEIFDKVAAKGREEGLVEGRNEGLIEGISMGRNEGLIEGISKGRSEGLIEGISMGRNEGLIEGRNEGLIEGRNNGMLETLAKLVSKGLLSLDNAAREANMSPDEFIARTAELGVGK